MCGGSGGVGLETMVKGADRDDTNRHKRSRVGTKAKR